MKASKTLHAPAKLNLTLEVLGRRADGMHGLRSVMVPVDLCDDIEIAPAGDFSFSCDRADLRENNIVESAMRALNVSHGGTSVTLKKRIPTGAGMGGGSSDAAAILLAGAHGMFGTLRGLDMVALAGSLGSDVPFFLAQTAALVEGTGERVTPLGTVPRWHAVIVKPPASISTAWAYEQIDKSERAKRPRSSSVSLQMCTALQRADFDGVSALLQNDFHDIIAAAEPQIAQALELLLQAGASHALLTGSGSCVFALVQTMEERETIAQRLSLPTGFEQYACAFYSGAAWRSAA